MKYGINIFMNLLLLLINNDALCQQTKESCKAISMLKTTNKQFDSIAINTINYIKKNCDYYRGDLSFKVDVLDKDDTVYIDITNSRIKDIYLTENQSPLLGYFVIDEHYFYVFRSFANDLFEKSGKEKIFILDREPNIILFEDNIEWLYIKPKNDNISLKKIMRPCHN